MKLTLYLTAVIICLSANYAMAQPSEIARIDLTGQQEKSLQLPQGIYNNTCYSNQKKHCNGFYVGEYMILGGGVLAMAGGVMLYDNRNNTTYSEQPADFICGAGCIILGIGFEVFRYSFRAEYGWHRRFVLQSDRNSLGIAYNL